MEPPTDPDGDGFYEDVNGDGSVDIVDVQALFKHYGNVDSATAAFDFNRDGEVNIVDIQALYVDIHTEEESDDSD